MIELKLEFTKKGINFKQIYKDDKMVIYQTSFPSYEIFRRVVHSPDIFHQDTYEQYPSNEAFGTWAWSCSDEASLNRMIKKHFPKHKFASEGFKL